MQSEQINELVTALAKAQAGMKNATLNKVNPHFKSKYADLAAITDAVRKPLAEQGIIFSQTTELRDGGLVLVTTLAHSSGQWMKSDWPLPSTGRPQEMGSALTYAKRYSLSSITGIAADEDDDAEGAEHGKQKIDARGIAPRKEAPPIQPPVNPETGELSPHAIPYDCGPVEWGGKYIAAIKTARDAAEMDAWRKANDATLIEVQKAAPKAFGSITRATLAQIQTFGQAMEAAE